MAATTNQQFRQLTTIETTDGEAYSSRFVRDAARNVNVSHAYACAPILVPNQVFPGGLVLGSESTLTYRMCWAPVTMPRPYRLLTIRVNGATTGGAGTHTLTFTADRELFNGTASADAASANLVLTSASVGWIVGDLGPFALDPFVTEPQLWLTLRSKSSDGATHAKLFTIHVAGKWAA